VVFFGISGPPSNPMGTITHELASSGRTAERRQVSRRAFGKVISGESG